MRRFFSSTLLLSYIALSVAMGQEPELFKKPTLKNADVALWHATLQEDLEGVTKALKAHANIYCKVDGETPFSLAWNRKHYKLVALFIEHRNNITKAKSLGKNKENIQPQSTRTITSYKTIATE